jgi:hypothetical protein
MRRELRAAEALEAQAEKNSGPTDSDAKDEYDA